MTAPAGEPDGEGPVASGLTCGLRPWHIRLLTDDPWVGGRGVTIETVGRMTVDQVLFQLSDRNGMKGRSGTVDTNIAGSFAGKDGMIKGRDSKGNPMQARVVGKSLARRLMEEQAAKEAAKAKPKRKRRGR